MAYHGTHADLNILMLFPWPPKLRIMVHGGQLGRQDNLTWRQYLAAVGEYWEANGKYPRTQVEIDNTQMTAADTVYMGQLFGLATRALLERGYVGFDGQLHPPVPFSPPPPS